MARRKKVQEPLNHERWLVSYADFITLLFAFFVVMYSISSVNQGKYRILSDSLESTFADPKRTLAPIQIGDVEKGAVEMPAQPDKTKPNVEQVPVYTAPPVSEETIKNINELSSQLNNSLKDFIDNDDVSIKQGEDWLELEMKSSVLFYSGEARLGKSAIPIIGKVADILRSSANPIQVEGFTDNNPIRTSRFPSNWELSAARAASVVHLLDRYGIDAPRLSAIGYGEYKPVADNATVAGRQKNRRVVLVVLGGQHSRRSLDAFSSSGKRQ